MKKALVVFLILAVAGGLFAAPTFSGSVETGFGIGFDDAEGTPEKPADKPLVGWIQNRGENGLAASLSVSGAGGGKDADGNPNPYGSWGGSFGIKLSAGRLGGSAYGIAVDGGNLWWQPNDFAYIQIGTGGPGGFGTPGGLGASQSILDNNGLKFRLTPISGLSIGVHAYADNAKKALEDMNIGLGVNYTMPSLLNIVANFRYKPEASTTAIVTKSADNKFDAFFGANFLGLSAVGLTKLAADVGTYNWGAPFQSIGVGEAITFKALENLLTLDLSGQQYFWMGDGADKRSTLADGFIPMRYRAALSYTIDKIVPAIQVQYTMGNAPGFNYRNANDMSSNVVTTPDADKAGLTSFDKAAEKLVALGISPQVTFNFGPTLIIGYNLQMDMSEDAKNTGWSTAATPVAFKKMQHLIYATVKVSF